MVVIIACTINYLKHSKGEFGAFAKNLIPRTYLIGKDGKVLYAGKGYTDKEFTELMEKIEKTL